MYSPLSVRTLRLGTALSAVSLMLLAGSPSAAEAQDSGNAATAPAQPGQSPANPAAPSAAAPEAGAPAEIVVTGSRIARPDLVASSPVAVISAETLRANNTVTLESILQQNPQFVPASGSTSNNPGTGAATVDLRGLGSQRTLVLIDGKRAPNFDTTGAVDINLIPPVLIKRVDVLTGGASAVYGSDSIAGVVNFILDDRFTGLRADASSSITQHGDGAEYDASLTGGLKLGDRGNIVVSGSWAKRDGVYFGDRRRNSQVLDSYDNLAPTGSSNTSPTVFDNTFNPASSASYYQLGSNNNLVEDIYQPYNYNPVNYAQLPFQRYTAFGLARYEITDNVEFFGRASYSHSKVRLQLAPTATAGFPFDISPDNPFLTPQQRGLFFSDPTTLNDDGTASIGIRRRITETPGRIQNFVNRGYQVLGGLRGSLGSNYNWEVFAQYGQNKRHLDLLNDLSYNALAQAIDAVPTTSGGVACRDPSNGCVPLNLFTTAPISQSALGFVLANGAQDDKTTQFVAGGSLGGDLGFLKSPFADKPAAFSVGVEYRRETGRTAVDARYGSGDLIYYGQGQNISGKYNVKEGYVELKAPLIQDKPFFQALNVEGGFRYSDYSTVGHVYTYKGGGDWSPIEGVRVRGIYQRAVRAPNLYELFSPVVAGTGSLSTDPCAGSGVTAGSALGQLCIATGAPASSIGRIPVPIAGQINILSGGNPNLKAEKSDTYTFGVVVNPRQLRGLSFSVDYYHVKIGNAINTFGGSEANIVNTCYNVVQNASDPFCQAIHRNTSTGALSGPIQFGVSEQLANIAVIRTDGIDVTAGYQGHAGKLTYGLSFAGTYVRAYDVQSDPTSPFYKCAGRFSSQCNLNPIPHWKHDAELTLGVGSASLLTRWRYIGAVKDDSEQDAGLAVSRIKAFNYFDETASVDIGRRMTLRLGVQNLFDKKPPIVGDTIGIDYTAGSTFPNVYDVLGRTFFTSISLKL